MFWHLSPRSKKGTPTPPTVFLSNVWANQNVSGLFRCHGMCRDALSVNGKTGVAHEFFTLKEEAGDRQKIPTFLTSCSGGERTATGTLVIPNMWTCVTFHRLPVLRETDRSPFKKFSVRAKNMPAFLWIAWNKLGEHVWKKGCWGEWGHKMCNCTIQEQLANPPNDLSKQYTPNTPRWICNPSLWSSLFH